MRDRTISPGEATALPRVPVSGGPYPPVPGWKMSFHACLDSTNLEGKRLVSRGVCEKRLIVAETQINGQCRHDRLWESPPEKGIWASFILPVSVPAASLPQSTLVLAVAVRNAIRNATGVSLDVKWPNDLLGNGRKCCGLLVETAGDLCPAESMPLILGVGINNSHARADFPPYLRENATSLSLLANGAVFPRARVLSCVAQSIDHWFSVWETRGFLPVREAWLTGNCTVGKTVLLPEGYGYASGTAMDVDSSGALVVRAEDGVSLLVDSGEILFTNSRSASAAHGPVADSEKKNAPAR